MKFIKMSVQQMFSLFCCLSVAGFQGCATLMGGSSGIANIKTTPAGAKFLISKNGQAIHSGVSPQAVQLKKRGSYVIRIEMDGYDPIETKIKKGLSGWYAGNIIFGGLLGLLIIDPLTGAMYTFPEKNTTFTLMQKKARLDRVDEGLAIVSIKDVPFELRAQLIPIAR